MCARITPEEPLVREHCLAGTALVPGWHMFCFFVCAPRIDRLPAILAERTASSPRCGASVRKYRYGGRMATLFLVAARPHCRPPPLEKARLATGLFFLHVCFGVNEGRVVGRPTDQAPTPPYRTHGRWEGLLLSRHISGWRNIFVVFLKGHPRTPQAFSCCFVEQAARSPECGAPVRQYRQGARTGTIILVATRPLCRPPPQDRAFMATGLLLDSPPSR